MAITANKEVAMKNAGVIQQYPVAAAATIFKGSSVMVSAAGYATSLTPTASTQFVGVALEKIDNSAGAAGAKYIRVYRDGSHSVVAVGQTQANVGDTVYWTDNETVGASASTRQLAGVITEFISATEVMVDVREGCIAPVTVP